MSQCLNQIKTFNAAAAPFSDAVLVNADHNCGAMILVRDARGHDSQYAGMPIAREDNNRRVALGIELFRDFLFGGGQDLFLNFLSLPILFVQKIRQFLRFSFILC